jgi:hypothetical protein
MMFATALSQRFFPVINKSTPKTGVLRKLVDGAGWKAISQQWLGNCFYKTHGIEATADLGSHR